ncbi:TlpA disulfide reductase family protein [Actinomarinicola tropica]|uniref:Redoxin family protein n=1 Tax=Actinomarinicola tropica TaxID=2789776 RepID=A0A5Q2RL91_9ACTN|nr:TlpA disulfide reductase family protein [Actinomarinicola tropica]QGG96254.1 redoxin family protein [Actinomarinicola tropica]
MSEPVTSARYVDATPPRRRTALIASSVVGMVMVAFVVMLALSDGGPDEDRSPLLGRAAPAVAGRTLDGGTFDIDDERGRWVLVNFFATWCAPCRVEHPELVAFYEAHAEAGDVEVVSVAFQNDLPDIEAFFAENGGEWPVLAEDVSSLAVDWGVRALPESFLVSPQGIVVHKFVGGVTMSDLESILAQARGLPPAPAEPDTEPAGTETDEATDDETEHLGE